MFITRRRLEEIKSHERWKRESELNREREMSEMWTKLHELEHKVAILETKASTLKVDQTTRKVDQTTLKVDQTWGTYV